MNNTVMNRSEKSTLDHFYLSIKKFFLQKHNSETDKTVIEKMEKYYDEMKSGDMNKVIKSNRKSKSHSSDKQKVSHY